MSLTSSGNSTVYVNNNTVSQHFLSVNTAIKIQNIMMKLPPKTTYKIIFRKGGKTLFEHDLCYDTNRYIVPFLYREENIIIWKKILPLNQDERLLSHTFLHNNSMKIMYDISKAILSLKKSEIVHNDTVLDNIGICDGVFVLFDFDGSGSFQEKGKDNYADFCSLRNSFKFRNIIVKDLPGIHSIIEYYSRLKNISLEKAFNELENLKISYSDSIQES
jgi:hypothetical protein